MNFTGFLNYWNEITLALCGKLENLFPHAEVSFYVILYFNKIKLIIPFDGELILNKQNIRKCCEECKKIKSEIKYLPKSRIIIDGEKQFVKIIKKHILWWLDNEILVFENNFSNFPYIAKIFLFQ